MVQNGDGSSETLKKSIFYSFWFFENSSIGVFKNVYVCESNAMFEATSRMRSKMLEV